MAVLAVSVGFIALLSVLAVVVGLDIHLVVRVMMVQPVPVVVLGLALILAPVLPALEEAQWGPMLGLLMVPVAVEVAVVVHTKRRPLVAATDLLGLQA
ncbi:hypothetical protein ACIOZM_15005 [Pseudomonas sp. NPDC087346]|uniref:hypothetical protein n=1 Tax=Pseudomonas sp. NPDC087346 TaxID=3364438 RepID=UPI0037FB4E62